jgi:hypothetical protein
MRPQRPASPARSARAALVAVAACLALASLAASPAAGRARRYRPDRAEAGLPMPWRGEVFVVGSSSIRHELGAIVLRDLRRQGFDVLRHGVSGTGLARPDRYDWFATSAWLPVSSRTLAVLVYLGVNDGQAVHEVGREWLPGLGRPPGRGETIPWDDPRWERAYMARTAAFIDSFCRRGARDVFVLLPVDLRRGPLEAKMARIRAVQREAVRWTQCGRALDASGDADWLLGEGERRAPRRRRDGFHMTRAGARIIWDRVRAEVLRGLDQVDAAAPR